MYLEQLNLRNFRSYSRTAIALENGMNILLGENGAGKTNVLEAIYLLSTTRSHRNDDDRELILFNQEAARVDGLVHSRQGDNRLTVVLQRKGKSLLVNGQPVKRNSEFVGRLNAVLFSPGDMDLFDTAPKSRRRLVDMEMGKLSSLYMYNLSLYLKCLKERNLYLKGDTDPVMLETYTEMLVEPAAHIVKDRARFVASLNTYLSYFYKQISGGEHTVAMVYRSFIAETEEEAAMREQITQVYGATREKDLFLKQTNAGIHREDYEFLLDGKNVSRYGSQGQKRMVILALKLSIVQIIYQLKREYPVLLLDDVFSELDENRRAALLKLLPESVQTIITATDLQDIDRLHRNNLQILTVRKGRVSA